VAISENRKEEFDERTRQSFFEDTQPASGVLRRRIREFRTAKGLTLQALAEAMTGVGVPLTFDKVSKIETGVRAVRYDELLAFAYVLDVPLAELIRPADGERPIRVGGIGLEQFEVANWLVFGPWWSRRGTRARKVIRLTREIQTMYQVLGEERNKELKAKHRQTLAMLVKELSEAAGIRPGIMEREALRETMAQPAVD
jgi:transcriptional regulator with XRE-family HTH domain